MAHIIKPQGLAIPKHIVAEKIEEIRFKVRKEKAIHELKTMPLYEKHVHFEGILEHIRVHFHEALPDDPEIRLLAEEHMERCRRKFWDNY